MGIDIETLIQFGFAGIALFMMYTIANHRLSSIEEILLEIRDLLTPR